MVEVSPPMSIDTLRRLLICDPEKGSIAWSDRPIDFFSAGTPSKQKAICLNWNARFSGKPAFTSVCNGYLSAEIWGRRYLAHRVIWAFAHGDWPQMLDHINGDRRDNRIGNLRVATYSDNAKNMRATKRNTSGVVGVRYCATNKNWRADITSDGVLIALGRFPEMGSAILARKAAEAKYNFHPNHGRA